jgi:amino acid transporter
METLAEPTRTTGTAGLRRNILTPIEVLAQSISTIAPVTTPALTVPLVFAIVGNGTWFAYLLAMTAMLLVGLCISRFSKYDSCAGSLHTYAASSLPKSVSNVAGWALLLAYIATGASVTGGFINFVNVFAVQFFHHALPPSLIAVVCVGAAMYIAYRDVQVSAQVMLWIELLSIVFVVVVLGILAWKNGLHLDRPQLNMPKVLGGLHASGIVLAIFSFVGFESATTLGTEARNPLKTIPRAVIQSALFAGIFFVVCCYLETQGMAAAHQDLGKSDAPMRVLATMAGVSPLGALIDFGALVSTFACALSCLTAAARVLLRMGEDGLAPRAFAVTHTEHRTPGAAVLATGLLTLAPVIFLVLRGISGMDVYGYLGSLAVYGFLTAYGLAVIALPVFLKRQGHLKGSDMALVGLAIAAILAATIGSVYPPSNERPYNWLPYAYLGYIVCAIVWQMFRNGKKQLA